MSDGIYVRVTYRDEICFEKKFRVISGDTIVLSVDDLVAEKIAVEREACEPKIYNDIDEMFRDMGVPVTEPEPVAWVAYENGERHGIDFDEEEIAKLPVGTMLYTAPPQREWQGLTDEEIKEIVGPWGDQPVKGYTRKLFDQIEAKLKEKNT